MKYRVLALALLFFTTPSLAQIELTADARKDLGMTIYNNNFAVIHDARSVELGRGDVALEFTDIARTIAPQTVILTSGEKKGFVAVQQNYRYDLLNRQSLLERFVGRKVKYSRSLLEDGTYETVLREGILLSINPEIVMFGDVIEIQPKGTISLPSLPSDLRTRPTLAFKGNNGKSGRQQLDLTYHASGISWEADYTLVIEKRAHLNGWVTVTNQSGSDFEVNDLQLVAGEVNKASPVLKHAPRAAAMEMMADASLPVTSEAGDYHRYSFPGDITLIKNDMTQLRLIDASDIRVEKTYRLTSSVNRYAHEVAEQQSPVSVLTFANSAKNDLGVPLPAGTMRVYTGETFVGEGRIGHEVAGGDVEVRLGRAFDIKVKRKQTNYRRLGDRAVEVGYEIVLTNAGGSPVTVDLEEKLNGDWEVIRESASGERRDSRTLVYKPSVPAGGKTTLTYTVRLGW